MNKCALMLSQLRLNASMATSWSNPSFLLPWAVCTYVLGRMSLDGCAVPQLPR